MRAIVLSGGGAKGAYQVGVWKALRKMGISYDIVTGTSIGSVNGLMMVQNDYFKSVWLWRNIGFDVIYDVDFPSKYDTLLELKEVYKNYAKHFFKDGGIGTEKMRSIVNKIYNEQKFKKSKINYGIVTFNLTKMKPLCIKKSEFKDNLIDYVLASACCYPALKKTKINGEEYIDGGYYDNMPINMAIELGAKEIIAVDLEAVGVKKTIKDENVKITYIRPKNDIGSFLVFDKNLSKRAIKYGYYDTMKVYNKLDGDKYTFKNGQLSKNYKKYSQKFIDNCKQVLNNEEGIYKELLKISFFSRILKSKSDFETKKIFNETIEFLGKLFLIDTCNIYDINKYNKMLLLKNKRKEQISKKYIEQKLKEKNFKELVNTSSIVKYLYNILENDNDLDDMSILASIFPKELIGAIYLKTIK